MSITEEFFEIIRTGNSTRLKDVLKTNPQLATSSNPEGVKPIMYAVYTSHGNLVEDLIDAGAEVGYFEALVLGKLDKVVSAIKVDPILVNAFSPDGFPAPGLAAFFGQIGILDYLLLHEANPNQAAQNSTRVMPLHSAVTYSKPEVALAMARNLISHGANVNATQQGGWTPLHEAALNNHVELARLLVEYGADVNCRSDDGTTSFKLAVDRSHKEMVQFLRGHGAKE